MVRIKSEAKKRGLNPGRFYHRIEKVYTEMKKVLCTAGAEQRIDVIRNRRRDSMYKKSKKKRVITAVIVIIVLIAMVVTMLLSALAYY